ncbi:MAG: diguanylate cyclase domain-containing protein, partial [Wenzhouxiangellaceae bacterium]
DLIGQRAVWDLEPDPGGRGMWVGSNGDGLLHIDADGRVLRRITREHGLGNNFVWSVLADGQGDIWAYTTRGLSRFDGQRVLNYDADDGLLHSEGISTSTLEGPEGVLWFGALTGLMRFDRRQPAWPDGAPPVFIEHAEVNGRELLPGEPLPPNVEAIRFNYAATSFVSEDSLRYRHRLLGHNDAWSAAAPYRPITYAGLEPGEYEFQVIAANAAGQWSERPARFAFEVAAPVWRRPWFGPLAMLASVLFVVLVVRMYEHRLRRRAADLERLVKTRTRELSRANLELRRVATTDPLTGLKNRRYLIEQIPHDIARLLRVQADSSGPSDQGLVFLLIDLDSFKQVNDQRGHPAGDRLLAQVARVLEGVTRGADYVVRWGGDEFLCVLRDADRVAGRHFAERLLTALRNHEFEFERGRRLEGFSGSIGICYYPFGREDLLSWDQVIEVADAAVYLAKRDGGGRWVEIAPVPRRGN